MAGDRNPRGLCIELTTDRIPHLVKGLSGNLSWNLKLSMMVHHWTPRVCSTGRVLRFRSRFFTSVPWTSSVIDNGTALLELTHFVSWKSPMAQCLEVFHPLSVRCDWLQTVMSHKHCGELYQLLFDLLVLYYILLFSSKHRMHNLVRT